MDAKIKQLSVVSSWRGGVAVIGQWMMIILPLLVITQISFKGYVFIPLYILTVMWIGARQHCLAILMHDATHYRLFKNRFWNNVISELFLAWPLFITTLSYRHNHLAHHRHLNTNQDPDYVSKTTYSDDIPDNKKEWQFPLKLSRLLLILLKDVTGLNTWQLWRIRSRYPSPQNNQTYSMLRTIYYVCFAGLITYFQLWEVFLLYWLVPLLTWFKCILRIRAIAEHFGTPEQRTRTVYPSVFDRLFIGGCNVWHHADHHLYPSVPFYHLPELHHEIQKYKPIYVTRGYWNVLKECIKT